MGQGVTHGPVLLRRRSIRWAVLLAGWTLIGFVYAGQMYLVYLRTNQPAPFIRLLLLGLIYWYSWAVLSALIFKLARRYPIERKKLPRSLAIHALAAVLFSIIHKMMPILGHCLFETIRGGHCQLPQRFFLSLFDFYFSNGLVIYWMILFASHALDYYRKYRDGELRASQLQAQLARAQLDALKMQLHPHFLFNTLHAISALVHKDPESADQMIARLSELLRLALENTGVHEVALRQELEFLERYLEIEKMRFKDRLTVRMSVDPGVLDAAVPNLILQPLVENAIRHAVAPRSAPGFIEIVGAHEDAMLRLEVRDDGPGLPASGLKEGLGLTNTRARLRQLYGANHRFETSSPGGAGFAVKLAIPLRIIDEPVRIAE